LQLPKENNRPIGGNSPNLVTLATGQVNASVVGLLASEILIFFPVSSDPTIDNYD
jgi:hypothetical protein